MTEKEKAKAYDEAIERAKKSYGNKIAEEIFPELKEDEAERIRKNCIHFLELQKRHHAATFEIEECIAWLEKQGEQKPCMVQWKGDNLKEVIGFTGKDKNFEKWFKSFEEYEKYVHEHNDIFKLFNENGSHYEIPVGAWIIKNPDGYNIAFNAVLKQKPTDKPRFSIGDWIISSVLGTARIIGVNDSNEYQLEYIDSEQKFSSIDYVNYAYDKWTIQDAKDGDVLATSAGAFIYNGNNGGSSCPGSYCGINTLGRFQTGTETHWTGKSVFPATKEQRDALMKAMNDAGYEWDTEKKELKRKKHKR